MMPGEVHGQGIDSQLEVFPRKRSGCLLLARLAKGLASAATESRDRSTDNQSLNETTAADG
jgi:hypothetical protein